MTDDFARDVRFAEDHSPGSPYLTASRIPTLVIPPEERPKWLPSPFALAAHMLGIAPLDDTETSVLQRGKDFEPVGVRLLERQHGIKVVDTQIRREHGSLPMLCWLDGMTDGGVPVELKTVDERDFDAWGPKPPLYPRCQAQAQACITGVDTVLIVAIVLGWKSVRAEVFEERRHDGFCEAIETSAGDFLAMLERRELPPMDETVSSYAAWQRIATITKGERYMLAEPEAERRWQALVQARADKAAAEKVEEASKMWLATRCREAEEIELLNGTVIKRTKTKRDGYTVAPTEFVTWKASK